MSKYRVVIQVVYTDSVEAESEETRPADRYYL